MDQRCEAAHAKLLSGTCPWCGKPVFNGRVIDDSLTVIDVDSGLATFTDTQIEFSESKVVGPSLKQLIEQEGPLDWQRAARYMADVARQLIEIHKTQNVHRNLRPGNIYVGPDGGIELRFEVPKHTRAAVDYLAPEQAIGAQVDGRTDVYSLGCTFLFSSYRPRSVR